MEAAMRFMVLSLAALAVAACNQAYIELPPFPDSGPDAADATSVADAPAEASDDGGDATIATEAGGEAQSDAPSEGATADGQASDGPVEATDAATE
jgi:hypothetical protein